MKRWKVIACLTVGALIVLGCEEQAELAPIELVDDNSVLGVWYLQAASVDRPIAIDTTVRFEFKEHGQALYEHTTSGPEAAEEYALTYNLAGTIISIDNASDAPGVPRLTGMIDLDESGQTLRITTHSDEQWLLTREARPGGVVEEARRVDQVKNKTDPMFIRVQQLAYACNTYVQKQGEPPTQVMDLVRAGLIGPEALTESGKADALPARFARMTEQERGAWLSGNSVFVFFFRHAGSGQSSSVVVSTLPENAKSRVVIGMANGAVYDKRAKEVVRLLQFQEGALPERWPDSAWSRSATVGLEPLSD